MDIIILAAKRILMLFRMLAPSTGSHLIATNAGWLMLDKIVRMGLALTIGAWVARHLGPSGFGQLAYAVTLIALCQGITNLGADGIIVRDLARNPSQAAEILGTTFRLRLLVGTTCLLLATGVAAVLRPQDQEAILLTAIIGLGLICQSADTIDLWFQSQARNVLTVSAKLIAYTAGNLVRIAMLIGNAPIWAFALALFVDALLLASALTIVYRRYPVSQQWVFSMQRSKALLSEAWPFMVSGIAALIYMRIDQIMIREMIGEHALGLYSAAVPLSQVWAVIPVTLATALAPYIAKKKLESHVGYMAELTKIFRVFAVLSLLVTLITILLAKPMITLLYGPAYEPAAAVLALHVCSNVFLFLGVAQGLWLVNEGHGRITLYRTGLGALVSIAGNWLLIPYYGLMGSAATTVMAQFIASVASNAIFAPQILRLQLLAFVPKLSWCRRYS